MSAPKLTEQERIIRFNANHIPEPNTGCWLWTAAINPTGYGSFRFRNRNDSSHRVSWMINHGNIPAGLCVLHKCDTRACVNPEHLFLGTKQDNMMDCVSKGRQPKKKLTHCQNGHELIESNLYQYRITEYHVARSCKICAKERGRKSRPKE